jgi:hypothetical protein
MTLAAKPRRVWVFQALLALQLATAMLGTVSAALSPEVRELSQPATPMTEGAVAYSNMAGFDLGKLLGPDA